MEDQKNVLVIKEDYVSDFENLKREANGRKKVTFYESQIIARSIHIYLVETLMKTQGFATVIERNEWSVTWEIIIPDRDHVVVKPDDEVDALLAKLRPQTLRMPELPEHDDNPEDIIDSVNLVVELGPTESSPITVTKKTHDNPNGLSQQQQKALEMLEQHAQSSPRGGVRFASTLLARQLNISRARGNQLINTLVAKGKVAKVDRTWIRLTEFTQPVPPTSLEPRTVLIQDFFNNGCLKSKEEIAAALRTIKNGVANNGDDPNLGRDLKQLARVLERMRPYMAD